MSCVIDLSLKSTEIINAIKKMKRKDREAFVEDLLAATSPEYLQSIKEARTDYKSGRTKTHNEIFEE